MAMAAASAAEIPANTTVQLPPPGATTTACARTVIADGETLGLQDVVDVGSGRARVEIDPALEDAIRASAATVKGFVDTGAVVYGVTTGFGAMSGVTVLREDVSMLQVNLIESHAAGVGEPFEREIVRGAMLLRVNSLVQGLSGIRLETIQLIVACLNADITPVVPSQGSVGCSGDLAPLSHMARALMGRGPVLYKGERADAATALAAEGLEPLVPVQKEGLALINGTQFMCSVLAHTLSRAYDVLEWAIVAAAASADGLRASLTPTDPRIHRARGHPGQMHVAARLREYLVDSEILRSHADCHKVQDAYSIRTAPQLIGAVKDTLDYASTVLGRELNAVTDNPIIADGEALQGGNFHGEPIALVADFVTIALVELGNMAERRVDRLVNPLVSGLPAFLCAGKAGLNSGYMIWQYTAAALASENKTSAFPASADTIPTSAYQEDHVSMGTIAARKAARVLLNLEKIVAIELMLAVRSHETLRPLKTGTALRPMLEAVAGLLGPVHGDRFFGEEFERVNEFCRANTVASISQPAEPAEPAEVRAAPE